MDLNARRPWGDDRAYHHLSPRERAEWWVWWESDNRRQMGRDFFGG